MQFVSKCFSVSVIIFVEMAATQEQTLDLGVSGFDLVGRFGTPYCCACCADSSDMEKEGRGQFKGHGLAKSSESRAISGFRDLHLKRKVLSHCHHSCG